MGWILLSLLEITIFFVISRLIYYACMGRKKRIETTKLKVPVVDGGLPFIGHGFQVLWDITGFMNKCYKKYGGIFRVRIFLKNIVVIADRSLAPNYFKENETSLSLEHSLRDLNFDWPFYERTLGLRNAIDFFRKSIAVKYDYMIPKIDKEARVIITRLKEKCEDKSGTYTCLLNDEMYRFIARTSFICFVSFELEDDILQQIRRLNTFANKLVLSSYFLPKSIVRATCQWRIRTLRKSLTSLFSPEIQKYRDDPNKIDSKLIRTAVDYEDNLEGKLSNTEIGELIVGFMFVSSENTSVGLTNAITFLTLPENSMILNQLFEECQGNLNSVEKLLSGKLLNACVLETARLSTHFFAIHRKPIKMLNVLGDYFIDNDIDSVALSGHMLMACGDSVKLYKDPEVFNPSRFLGQNSEPTASPHHVTWGGGRHACPGKIFALMEIKLALAHLVCNFDFKIVGKVHGFDYFSPIAFADRKISIRLTVKK